jgi:type II secretory pathway pseudopilin PulG
MRSNRRLRPQRASVRGGDRGMSLVEATIVLMVLSVITSIMAPPVLEYVRTSEQAAATHDVAHIGAALARMLDDLGETSILRDGNGASVTAPPSHASGNRVDMLVTQGQTPALDPAAVRPGATDWDNAVNNAAIQMLDYYLVTNTPSNLAANAYRTASSMSVTMEFDPDVGAMFNAEHAWRGAYLPGPLGPDPWGNRYAINVEFLERPLGAGPSGNVNDVFVLSAGSDGRVETRFAVDGVTTGNDVIFVVSGGTR